MAQDQNDLSIIFNELTVFGNRQTGEMMHLLRTVSVLNSQNISFLNSQTTADKANLNAAYQFIEERRHNRNLDVFLAHTWEITPHHTMTDGVRVGYSSLRSTLVSDRFYPSASISDASGKGSIKSSPTRCTGSLTNCPVVFCSFKWRGLFGQNAYFSGQAC